MAFTGHAVIEGYAVITSKHCAAAGWVPINDVAECEAAAKALGLSDTTVIHQTPDTPRPEGCFWHTGGDDVGDLAFATDPANTGKGAETSESGKLRHPICKRPVRIHTPTAPACNLAANGGDTALDGGDTALPFEYSRRAKFHRRLQSCPRG